MRLVATAGQHIEIPHAAIHAGGDMQGTPGLRDFSFVRFTVRSGR